MRVIVTLVLLAMLAGCASPKNDRSAPVAQTQRQHDSMLGASRVPGASGIGAAVRVADSADARRRREDSVGRNP